MENTSVSKGVFVNKGSYKIGKRKNIISHSNYPYPWYDAYKEAWSVIEKAAQQSNYNTFKQVLSDLYNFVLQTKSNSKNSNVIPTATLMTGVNLQDHDILFEQLICEIKKVTSYIAVLSPRNCSNLKNIMEDTVSQFVNNEKKGNFSKCQTFYDLKMWCDINEKQISNKPFVVMIPEFESINVNVLSDFILSISCYTNFIKFVFILGVGTTIRAVHAAFTYNVISKLEIKVYHMPNQIDRLTDIIEGTMLSVKTSFKLIGRAMQLLADNFIFNELSVQGYLQGYKICMINMFFNKNLRILCCKSDNVKEQIKLLNKEDILEIQKFPSVINEIEREELVKHTKLSDQDFKDLLETMVKNFHNYMDMFIIMLKCLHSLLQGLPSKTFVSDTLVKKKLREVYVTAVSSDITKLTEYDQSMRLLNMLSKDELLIKMEAFMLIINKFKAYIPDDVVNKLNNFIDIVKSANEVVIDEDDENDVKCFSSRTEFNKSLHKNLKQSESPYMKARLELINFIDKDIFSVYLKNPNKIPASEIFSFNKNYLVKSHILGSMKGAINKAVIDPHAYLQCSCCAIEMENLILPTMLDICILYKLHSEHTKLINMYDWLQSFLHIVNPNETCDEQRQVNPVLRARFTQAVADMEHLGFIKVSKKKVDHVKRLMLI